MRISTKSYPLKRITFIVFGTLFGLTALTSARTGDLGLLYSLGGVMLFFGTLIYFLIPNTTEVHLNESTVDLKKGQTQLTEQIENIDQLKELLNFTNEIWSNWSLYRMDFRTANKLGDSIFFLTKKSNVLGQGNRKAIGELNYKIALNKQKTNKP